MKRKLLSNSLALFSVQVANYAVPLFVLIYLTSKLNVDHYGVLAFAQSIIGLCAVVIDFGFGLSATEKIAKNSLDKNCVNQVISGVWGVQLALFLIVSVVVIIYAIFSEKYSEYRLIFFFSLFPIFAQCLTPVWFFYGLELMRPLAWVTIFSRFLFAGFVVIFVNASGDYYRVPLLNGFSHFIVLFFSIFIIRKLGYVIKFPSVRDLYYCLRFTKYFFISRVSVAIYMSSATFVLGLIGTQSAVAMYSIAEQFYRAMQSVFAPVVQSVYPYMVKQKDIVLALRISVFCIVLAIGGAVVGYALSPFLFSFFFNESWQASLSILNIFFIALVVHAAAVMVGYPLAAALDNVQVANSSLSWGAIVFLVLLIFGYSYDFVMPEYLAIIMICSELYIFLHRIFKLAPAVIDQYSKST